MLRCVGSRVVRWWCGFALPAVTLLALAAGPAAATPLDQAQCDALDRERNELEAAGVLADMRLGVEFARSLAEDRQRKVVRYVELQGQLLFRCPSPAPPETAGKDKAAKSADAQAAGKKKTTTPTKTQTRTTPVAPPKKKQAGG